ncbi:MAG: DUF3082 domain-containing protein [Cyanobacteria bacterium J06597_1]
MTQSNTPSPSAKDPGFIKVSTGTVISGGMAYLFIRLLMSILKNLPPIAVNGSPLARSISIGVRYMLVGSIGLMAFMFSVVTIGLLAYSIQLAWQGLTGRGAIDRQHSSTSSPPDIGTIVATEREADSRDRTSMAAHENLEKDEPGEDEQTSASNSTS